MNDANRDGESSLNRKTSNDREKQMKAKNLSCGGCDEFYFVESFGLFNGDVALQYLNTIFVAILQKINNKDLVKHKLCWACMV